MRYCDHRLRVRRALKDLSNEALHIASCSALGHHLISGLEGAILCYDGSQLVCPELWAIEAHTEKKEEGV